MRAPSGAVAATFEQEGVARDAMELADAFAATDAAEADGVVGGDAGGVVSGRMPRCTVHESVIQHGGVLELMAVAVTRIGWPR